MMQGKQQLTHVCCSFCCRRQREIARQNEMAERERQTQELLKSCEVCRQLLYVCSWFGI